MLFLYKKITIFIFNVLTLAYVNCFLYVCSMELIDENNSIRFTKFKCLVTNSIYEIVQSKCTGRYVRDSVDTIVKDGVIRKEFARGELSVRFKEVEEIKSRDYTLTKKKKKR